MKLRDVNNVIPKKLVKFLFIRMEHVNTYTIYALILNAEMFEKLEKISSKIGKMHYFSLFEKILTFR